MGKCVGQVQGYNLFRLLISMEEILEGWNGLAVLFAVSNRVKAGRSGLRSIKYSARVLIRLEIYIGFNRLGTEEWKKYIKLPQRRNLTPNLGHPNLDDLPSPE